MVFPQRSAYRKLAANNSEQSFAGWIYAIAVNLQKDRGRRRSPEFLVREEPHERRVYPHIIVEHRPVIVISGRFFDAL